MAIEKIIVEDAVPDGLAPLDKVVVHRANGRAAMVATDQSIARLAFQF